MKQCLARILVILAAIPASSVLAEIVGPYNIVQAPVSAQLISGGGPSWAWCNVVNSAIDLNTAFSGSPIIDDGYCNGTTGTTVQVEFGSPIVNGAGNEFVMFDGRFSPNDYRVATNWDNFGATLLLPANAFTDTGVDRDYYYGGTGPFSANVMGHAFDLSDLGVPLGSSVTSVRFIAVSSQVDPLGIGALVPEPSTLVFMSAAVMLLRRRTRK